MYREENGEYAYWYQGVESLDNLLFIIFVFLFFPIIQNVTQKMRSNQGIQFVVGNVDTGSCTRKGQREVSFCQLGVMLLCIKNYYVFKGILWTKKSVDKKTRVPKRKKKWMLVSEWQAVNPFNFQYLIDNSPL